MVTLKKQIRKVLLFDLDWTLIYTGGAGLRALNHAYKKIYGLAEAAKVKPGAAANDIETVRRIRDEAQVQLASILERQATINAKLPEVERIIVRIRGETPGLSYLQQDAEVPACPVCEVPIDGALAEGCGMSNKLPDLESIRQRRERLQQDLDAERQTLANLNEDKRKQSMYFPEAMLTEIQHEADRQDRSLSWIIQRAW